MNWTKLESRSVTFFSARAEKNANIAECMEELWQKFFADVIPLQDPSSWNFIKAEIWPDSGRIIVVPSADPSKRDERGGCQVEIAPLLAKWNSVVEEGLDETDEDEFEALVNSEVEAYAHQFLDAVPVDALPRESLRIECYDSDEVEPMLERVVTRG